MKKLYLMIAFLFMLGFGWGCSSGDSDSSEQPMQQAANNGLSQWELENGIGPVKNTMTLNAVDSELAASGEKIFDMKCMACHKMAERYIGPALGDVMQRRTPEFVMNMMLNPDEMVKKHPEVQKMLATYMVPMTFQNVSEADSRALLEYIRANQK